MADKIRNKTIDSATRMIETIKGLKKEPLVLREGEYTAEYTGPLTASEIAAFEAKKYKER